MTGDFTSEEWDGKGQYEYYFAKFGFSGPVSAATQTLDTFDYR